MSKIMGSVLMLIILTSFLLSGCSNSIEEVIPLSPKNLIATNETDSQISLAWTDSSDNETGFEIELSSDDFTTSVDNIILPENTTSFDVDGLNSGTSYSLRVRAVNNIGNSEWSNTVKQKTNDFILNRPNDPGNVVATSDVYDTINVTWTDNSDDENGFYIQWATDSGFVDYNDEDIEVNETSFIIPGLIASTTYYVRIRAENSIADSFWVESNSVTTPAIPEGVYKINNDAPYTNSTTVTLNSNYVNMDQMHFVNYGGSWSSWESYSSTKSWTLTNVEGFNEVTAEFKDSAGTVTQVSDSIILDTTPPVANSFVINSDDASTSTNFVTLSMAVPGAVAMRFQNDGDTWSGWISYSSSYGWLMTTVNGQKIIYAEFKDAAGNVSQPVSDTIDLDSTSPTINSFTINSGDECAFSTDVVLNLDVSGEPSMMRFQNTSIFGTWTPWEPYSSTKTWTINEGENEDHYVFLEVKDSLGNVSSSNDFIYLDEYTTLEIYSWRIYVGWSGDFPDSAEWYWHAYYDLNDSGTNDICTGYVENVNNNDEITIEDIFHIQFPNADFIHFNLYYHAIEDDYPFSNDDVGIANISYSYHKDYYKSFDESFVYTGGEEVYPSGQILGYIKKIE